MSVEATRGGGALELSRANSASRAHAVRAYLRARRTGRFRPSAYQIYLTLLLAGIFGALGAHAISKVIGGSLSVHELLVFGPALLLLVLLGAARFGTWQGPVSFSDADAAFILAAPIALGDVVRPKLDLGLALGAIGGAVIGGAVLVLMAIGSQTLTVAGSVCGVIGFAALAVLAVAASWLVESSRSAAGFVRRASPLIALAAVALLWVANSGSVGRTVAVWSGPWGWAVAPFTGTHLWPVAVAALLMLTLAAAVIARRRSGAATLEQFIARAQTRSGLTASAFTLDYRSAALTYRAGAGTTSRRTTRVPRPRHARFVVVWRDALALMRDLSRIAWAILLGAGGTLELLTHPGRLVPALLGAGALYFAASLVSEPLRIDVDQPDTGAVLLSWPFARLLLAHCVLPAVVLFGVVAVSVAGAVLAGAAGGTSLALIPTVAIPVVATAVLCAALASLRGGRLGDTLLNQMMTADPSNPVGATVVVFWLAPWLLVNVAVCSGAALIVGHAVQHDRPLGSAGVAAVFLSGVAAVVLWSRARRVRRPD